MVVVVFKSSYNFLMANENEVTPEKPLITWTAPTRPFKKRTREFYINLFAVSGLIGLIIFLIEGIIPVILIVSLLFIFYIFSTIEPENAEYSLTSFGVRINGKMIKYWEELGLYWFAKRMNDETLVLETNTAPWRIEFVIDRGKKEEIEKIISKKLYKHESPETPLDKASKWIGDKIKI